MKRGLDRFDGRTMQHRAGVETMTTVTSGVEVSVDITFVPPFPADVAPVITLAVRSAHPGLNEPAYSDPTNTGFTLWLVRNTDGADIDVSWRAEVPTQ